MEEDRGGNEKAAASRVEGGGLDVHVCGGGIQPGADEESAGQPGWCRMSQRISASVLGESGQNGPQIQALTRSKCNLGAAHPLFDIMRVTDFQKTVRFSVAC